MNIRGYVKPMMDCSKFYACSAPICPLDPEMSKRDGPIDSEEGGVREPECKLGKDKRVELGGDLAWRGLWPRELASAKKWENKTVDERSAQMLLACKNLDLA